MPELRNIDGGLGEVSREVCVTIRAGVDTNTCSGIPIQILHRTILWETKTKTRMKIVTFDRALYTTEGSASHTFDTRWDNFRHWGCVV